MERLGIDKPTRLESGHGESHWGFDSPSLRQVLVLEEMRLLAFALLLTMVSPLAADTPMLHRRTGPPEPPQMSCGDELSNMRKTLVGIAKNEAVLANKVRDRKSAKEFRKTAATMQTVPWLTPSAETCNTRNLKLLRVLVAEWQYYYAQDYTHVYQETK